MLRNFRINLKSSSVHRYWLCSYSKNREDFTENSYKPINSRRRYREKLTRKFPKYSPCDLLIPPKDFPFFLPGNVGMAWSNYESTLETATNSKFLPLNDIKNSEIMLCVDACPVVVRPHLNKVFSICHLSNANLTVITFSMKYNQERYKHNLEMELEKTAQMFVLNAKSICDKLRKDGFWADFVNPFSGKPYSSFKLFNDKSQQLDNAVHKYSNFETVIVNKCKIVSQNLFQQKFIGNIFTNAPAQKSILDPILWNQFIYV